MLLMRFWIHSILKESRNKVKDLVLVWRYDEVADGKQDRRSVVEKEETDQVMGQIKKRELKNRILQYLLFLHSL